MKGDTHDKTITGGPVIFNELWILGFNLIKYLLNNRQV